ncbi:hypothetical protein BDZ97DRAFT_1830116, partial [Flammula alnicola]
MFKFETRLKLQLVFFSTTFVEAPSLHTSLAGRISEFFVRIPQTLNVEQNVWIHGDS